MATLLEGKIIAREVDYGRAASVVVRYSVSDLTDPASETEVLAFVLANTATSITLISSSLPRSLVRLSRRSAKRWDAFVTYSRGGVSPGAPNNQITTFDIQAVTEQIFVSRSTIVAYDTDGAVTSPFKQAINVDGEGNVHGVEIGGSQAPGILTTQRTLANDTITGAYVKTIMDTCNTINSGPYTIKTQEYPAGSLRFIGATGQLQNDSLWNVTYRFGYWKGDPANDPVGDITVVAERWGWDYRWVSYKETIDAGATDIRLAVPNIVVIDRVYLTDDFSGLALLSDDLRDIGLTLP